MRPGIKQGTFIAEAVRMLYMVIYCCCPSKTLYFQISRFLGNGKKTLTLFKQLNTVVKFNKHFLILFIKNVER